MSAQSSTGMVNNIMNNTKPSFAIPPYMIAEAMSSLHGLDLRWSSPITPTEMQYVEQYVKARYPEFYQSATSLLPSVREEDSYAEVASAAAAAAAGGGSRVNSSNSPSPVDDIKRRSPGTGNKEWGDRKLALAPSRVLDILTQKATSNDTAVSIPELHARNTLLKHLGVTDNDYLAVFTGNLKEAMMLVGECYPFLRYTYYMTVLDEEMDCIREFASYKEAKIILAPANWLDLRIAGSQLSQSFRRKSKQIPKGLFAYPVDIRGTRNSLHWVSEAQRNSWHVLLDASGLQLCDEQLNLTLHKPDYVICKLSKVVGHSTGMTCLLVRRSSFDFQ